MKRLKYSKKFLEEIKEIPIISAVAKKLGVSRNTIYRWRKEHPEFREALDKALNVGRDAVSDLAESQLIKNLQGGDMGAIKYWLGNNKTNYMQPRPKDWLNVLSPPAPKPMGNQITFVDFTKEKKDEEPAPTT